MNNLFNYIFYRVFKAYQKKDSNPEIYASGVLTLMQFLVLIDLMFTLQLFYDFEIPSKFVFIPILILLIGINWLKYERNFDFKMLDARWVAEDNTQRRRRGWLIVMSLISLILFPILIGVLKHNLGIL